MLKKKVTFAVIFEPLYKMTPLTYPFKVIELDDFMFEPVRSACGELRRLF